MPALSVIMPAYNEHLTIADAIAEVDQYVAAVEPSLEMIVVDDGSNDSTAQIVKELQGRYAYVKLMQQPNGGHGVALRNGIEGSSGDWLLLLDSDCQIDLSDFVRHWQARNTWDVFLGVRRPRNDPRFRLVISQFMKALLTVFAGVSPRDAGAPYKIVARPVWQAASPFIERGSWVPSVLLAAFALKNRRFRVVQSDIIHKSRPHGESTLNAKRLAKFCVKATREIWTFGRMTARLNG